MVGNNTIPGQSKPLLLWVKSDSVQTLKQWPTGAVDKTAVWGLYCMCHGLS